MSNTASAATKPKWVEALDESERVLRLAEAAKSEERDALIRLAGAWRDISDRYKGSGASRAR